MDAVGSTEATSGTMALRQPPITTKSHCPHDCLTGRYSTTPIQAGRLSIFFHINTGINTLRRTALLNPILITSNHYHIPSPSLSHYSTSFT